MLSASESMGLQGLATDTLWLPQQRLIASMDETASLGPSSWSLVCIGRQESVGGLLKDGNGLVRFHAACNTRTILGGRTARARVVRALEAACYAKRRRRLASSGGAAARA